MDADAVPLETIIYGKIADEEQLGRAAGDVPLAGS
jgi:hypothetical protein